MDVVFKNPISSAAFGIHIVDSIDLGEEEVVDRKLLQQLCFADWTG